MESYRNSINGQLVGSEEVFDSINPANGEILGRVPQSSQRQVGASRRRA